MKKAMICLAAAVMAALAGCSGTPEGTPEPESTVVTNESFSSESMLTVSGETVSPESDDVFGSTGLGVAAPVPESWLGLPAGCLGQSEDEGSLYISYFPEATAEWLSGLDTGTMSQDELAQAYDRLQSEQVDVLRISAVPSGEELEEFGESENVGSAFGRDYYVAYIASAPEELGEADSANVEALIAGAREIAGSLIIFPPEGMESSFGGSLESFSAEDMDGNAVTEEIFSEYDLTMVNLWTTWCVYCIEEMPALQELYAQLPENVNMITVCGDAETEHELAQQILSDSGAQFTTIAANDELQSELLAYVTGFPTTVFVDSTGKAVGEPLMGMPRDTVSGYMQEIEARLPYAEG